LFDNGNTDMEPQTMTLTKRAAITAIAVILWLAWVEAACFARLRLANTDTDIIPRAHLQAVYQDAPWVNTLADEWKPSNAFSYKSYVGWERKPFHGQTINIDETGVRKTDPSHCDDPNALTIWTFGGSTIWGAGVPDWLTIPSLLAQRFEKDGHPVCVRNYGEKAWVNTQEMVKLTLELKRAQRKPNLVIFYDGPADVYETYQSGQAGLHQNFNDTKQTLESRASSAYGTFRYLLDSNTARVLLHHRQEPSRSTVDLDTQARATIRCYLENVRLVQSLAREYKFEPFFFWEPTLSNGSKRLTPGEEQVRLTARLQTPGLEEANQAAYILLKSQAHPPVFPIADALDSATDTIYFDEAHITAEGNNLIAERIFETIRSSTR
jgi:lysophospholipase L1-like esterase